MRNLIKSLILNSSILFGVFSNELHSQTVTLINPISVQLSQLTSDQLIKYNKIISNQIFTTVWFVEVGNLSSIQQNGWLSLSMPDKECIASVQARHVESFETGNFYWHGEIQKSDGENEESCSCYEGYINITKHAGEIFGTITVDDDKYELIDLGEDRQILAKKDFSITPKHCGNTNEEGGGFSPPLGTRTGGNCPVRVLALFTANGEAAVADIENTIRQSINDANQALRNSDVDACQLQLNLVGIQEIVFNETNIPQDDINALLIQTAQLRNDNNADIVVVYTHGNYGVIFGRAGTLTLDPNSALCVIEAAEANNEFNTAHEIAHIFACRHEPEEDNTGPFEHAHEFKTGCWPFRKKRNTIMFSSTTGRTIQHYSNPNVEYKDKPTGVPNSRHNSRQLINNACIVANFVDDDLIPFLTASIRGSGYGCQYENVQLNAVGNGGAPGPYLFEWRISSDGFIWSPIQSTGETFVVSLPCDIGEGVYVQLRIRSVDGQVATTFRFIQVAEKWPGQQGFCPKKWPCPRSKRISHFHSQYVDDVKIFPNPFSDNIRLSFNRVNNENISIKLTDAFGKLLLYSELNSINTNEGIEIPTYNLPKGMYYIHVGDIIVRKIIKTN